MQVRNIGPTLVTGRVEDIEIDPKNPNVWYVASAFGGLWKTTNRGITFDQIFPTNRRGRGASTLCCVVVDPKDSNVVWLGTGENNSQRSAHFGTGLYKSTDAGKTWKRVGLENSEHIGKIVIDPRNSNVVWVAAQGPLFSAGGDRGVYKTTDGGATWTRVLHVNDDTGFTDIVFDPKNPDIMFAGTYQRRRHVGQMIGGGPDGGIWKTTNGGKNWTKLTNGLPPGEVGPHRARGRSEEARPRVRAHRRESCRRRWRTRRWRSGCGRRRAGAAAAGAAAPPAAVPQAAARGQAGGGGRAGGRVRQAAAAGAPAAGAPPLPPPPTPDDSRGFYQTDDNGATWTRMSTYRGGGPAYYSRDLRRPAQPDTIWSVNTNLEWSKDGGQTWSTGRRRAEHGALGRPGSLPCTSIITTSTFDPERSRTTSSSATTAACTRPYERRPATWRFFSNLPITQYYRVGTATRSRSTRCAAARRTTSRCAVRRARRTRSASARATGT